MRLLKHRRLHVNMGQYEHIETSATVEVDTEADKDLLAEVGVDSHDLTAVENFLDEELSLLLITDVEAARAGTLVEDSFIHDYAQNTKEK